MPKLNKCKYRVKSDEMIGQKKDGFHFGFQIVFRCTLDNAKCIGMKKCNKYKEKIQDDIQFDIENKAFPVGMYDFDYGNEKETI